MLAIQTPDGHIYMRSVIRVVVLNGKVSIYVCGKGKGKFHPITGHEGPEWSRGIALLVL
jgi:hypothetical protein